MFILHNRTIIISQTAHIRCVQGESSAWEVVQLAGVNCTWPVSQRRMPGQTSASHILLYSHAFVIRVDLRQHCFWSLAFLVGTNRLGRVCGAAAISK
jgi:hypothetical protein